MREGPVLIVHPRNRGRLLSSLLIAGMALTVLPAARCEHQTTPQVQGARDVVAADAAEEVDDDMPPDQDVGDLSGLACNFSGVWGLRQIAFNQDTIIGAAQVSSQWYIVEFQQNEDGTFDTLSSRECGVEVKGSASIVLTPDSVTGAMFRNPWAGRVAGTFRLDGDTCEVEFPPFYTVLGADRERFLPEDVSDNPSIADLQESLPLPTEEEPDGAEDWDGDGSGGVAYQVSGAINGRRNEVQRYWYTYFTDETYTVEPGSDAFTLRSNLENETSIIALDGCDPLCGLLAAASVVSPGKEHRTHFRRFGDDFDDPAFDEIRGEDELETCFNLRELMPHEGETE